MPKAHPLFQEYSMQYYFAPLEGITDSIYRQIHHKYFPGADRYYTPFISPTIHRSFTPREQRELQPAEPLNYTLVPQVLTKSAEDCLWLAEQCAALGYTELNLNLGCPSGTVTAKGKGAGALRDLETLERFLDSIFTAAAIPISVKTRIGFDSAEEFPKLLELFNHYPIPELTIHPRTRSAFYNGNVDMQAFSYAVENSKNPLCYNGNLCCKEQIDRFAESFPTVTSVMIGRGLIGDPGMLTAGGTTAIALEQFHDELLDTYTVAFGSSRNAMFRMKENWHYLAYRFNDSEKLYKKLRKTTDIQEYKAIAHSIFHTLPLAEHLNPNW